MYCDFFQLERLPFNNTPDPRFFFNTPDHEEALASLLYAAEQRKGFVLVTGEVGSGKTLLSRMLIGKLGSSVRTAVINNTRLSGRELLLAICREFEIEIQDGAAASEISHSLEQFLLEQYARDRLAVVVLDEAQNLPLEAFEELRMLGNLEADDAKLLQVLILGQPELQDSFRQPSMRQLYQRVFRTFHLRALSRELSDGYIRHRLAVAGLPQGEDVFEPEAYEAIYRHSEGIPRLLNQICDNSMLAAYTENARLVTAKMVREVVEQMMALTVVSTEPKPKGAFARQMLGLGASADSAGRRASAPRSAVGESNGAEPSEAASGRFQEFDKVLGRMADRLEASERTLADIQRRRGSTGDASGDAWNHPDMSDQARQQIGDVLHKIEERNGALQGQVTQLLDALRYQAESQQQRTTDLSAQHRAEMEEARRTREQAEQVLGEARTSSRQAEEQIRRLLEEAKQASARIQEQAAATLGDTEKQNAVLAAQAKHLLTDVHAYTSGQQNRLSDLLSQERAEFEAAHQMRRQASELLTEVTKTTQQANERIREVLDEACRTAESVEKQAALSLSETEKQNATLREQVGQFLEQVRTQSDEQRQQAADLVALHKKELDDARQQMQVLQQAMKQRDEEVRHVGEEAVQHVRTQAKALNDQLEVLRQSVENRTGELGASVETLKVQTQSRMEEMHRQLTAVISGAAGEVQTARDSFVAVKDQLLADAQGGHAQVRSLVEQAEDVLVKAREQAAAMLAHLRAQVTEQTEKTEKIWQTAAAEGARTLNDLQSKLSETRMLTDRSRTDLENVVQDAMSQIAGARGALESGLNAHKTEIARLSKDAAAIKTDIARRFEEARKELETAVLKHEQVSRSRAVRLIGETDESITAAESRAKQTVQSLQVQLKNAAGTAERIYGELQQSLAALQQNAAQHRAQYENDAARLQRELPELIERNRQLIEAAETQVEAISQRASNTVQELQGRLDELKNSAKTAVTGIGEQLDSCLAEAGQSAEKLRAESETVAANLAERMNQTRRKAEVATTHAEKAVNGLREQSRNALTEVRAGLAQMIKRCELLQHDLTLMRDEINETAKGSCQQLQLTATSITEHIEALRDTAQRDADANHRRMTSLREQVEQGAEQIRQNANKLLDQVQAGTASLREHANEMLAQAQSGSDKIGEQAASLLMQAHTSAERFREQAETLLRRAEAVTEAVRNDVASIRSEILRDTQEVREQISTSKQELVEARGNSAELLRQAADIKERSEALVNMPRQLVEEATQRTTALSDMSKKVSGVVQQLASASEEAQQNKNMLEQANASANETAELLKRHTARVGQLVGIIRQLYGSMDARIEGLRSRLDQADEVCRAVPQQIDRLRTALDLGTPRPQIMAEPKPPAATPRPAPKPAVAPKAAVPTPAKKPAMPTGKTTSTPQRRTLGEVVERNKKLNEWLREVLNEEAPPSSSKPATPVNRMNQEAAVKK